MKKCRCGCKPEIVKENDGFYYIICPNDCGQESAWGETKREAVEEWNEMRRSHK
jgi:hypothetical protein